MNDFDQLRRLLAEAQNDAEREGSDRHSNPGRLRREMRRQADARIRASEIQRAIDLADELAGQGLPWDYMNGAIHFVLTDGRRYPAGQGDVLQAQIALITSLRDPLAAHDLYNQLLLVGFDPTGDRDLGWLVERMEGVLKNRLRTVFLVGAGMLEPIDDGLRLTSAAREHELLREHEGQFGPWHTATALGAALIYGAYRRGNLPVRAGAYPTAICSHPQLDAIAEANRDALALLPPELRRFAEQPVTISVPRPPRRDAVTVSRRRTGRPQASRKD